MKYKLNFHHVLDVYVLNFMVMHFITVRAHLDMFSWRLPWLINNVNWGKTGLVRFTTFIIPKSEAMYWTGGSEKNHLFRVFTFWDKKTFFWIQDFNPHKCLYLAWKLWKPLCRWYFLWKISYSQRSVKN